jgi:predicted DNA-binding transcriptional regulator AlpA
VASLWEVDMRTAQSNIRRRFVQSDHGAFLTAGQVRERYNISDMWIYRKLLAGAFPKPVRLGGGRLRFWRVADLLAWEAAQ